MIRQPATTPDARLLKKEALLRLHDGILMEIGDGYARIGRRKCCHRFAAEVCNFRNLSEK